MDKLLILFISILPVYVIGLYVYRKDVEREPKPLLRKLFIYGMLSCIPAAIIELVVEPFFGYEEDMNLVFLFFYVSVGIALVEELCKWFIVYKGTYYHKEFNQPYDAIVYCVFTSLGFACLENVLYVSMSGIFAGILRAITAIPGHAADAIVMGYYFGLAKENEVKKGSSKNTTRYLILSMVMPTILHAIYDYCLFANDIAFLGLFILFIIFIYIYGINKIKQISTHNKNFIEDNLHGYCPNCGTELSGVGNFCASCGAPLNDINNEVNDLTH